MKSRIARRAVTVTTAAALAAAGGFALSTAGTATAATPQAVKACTTAGLSADFQLQPNLGDRPETEGVALIMLTNKSKHTCTVRGYVGLGYVDTKNKHHSSTANRSKKIKVTTITLKPGHTAFAGANFISQPNGCAKATKRWRRPPRRSTSRLTTGRQHLQHPTSPWLTTSGGINGVELAVTLLGAVLEKKFSQAGAGAAADAGP